VLRGLKLTIPIAFVVGPSLLAQSDMFEWSLFASLDADQRITAIAFSPDGLRGAFATIGGAVQLFDLTSRPRSFHTIAQQMGHVVSLRFASDNSALMSAAEDGTVLLVSISGVDRRTMRVKNRLLSAAMSRDGTLLATAAADKTVAIWDIQSNRLLGQLQHKSKQPFFALGFDEKDTSLIGVSQSGAICEWDVKTRAVLRQIQDSDQTLQSATIGETGKLLAVGTEFANFQKGAFGQVSPARAGLPGLSGGADDRNVAAIPVSGTARATDVYRENRIKLYDLEHGSVAKALGGINGGVVALALSPDGRFVGFIRQATKDSFLVVYDTRRGVEVASTHLPAAGTGVTFSSKGQWLGTATDRGNFLVWTVKGITPEIAPDDLRGVVYRVTSRNNAPLIDPAHPVSIAVMDFDANGADAQIGRAVSDMVRTRIGEGENVKIVERAQIDRIIKEQDFQISDRVDPATAVRLGRMLGAGKIIFGSVSKLDTRFTINVRSVDIETGAVDGEREITCEPCGVSGLQEAVVRLKPVLVR
jgi:hypothetical protein